MPGNPLVEASYDIEEKNRWALQRHIDECHSEELGGIDYPYFPPYPPPPERQLEQERDLLDNPTVQKIGIAIMLVGSFSIFFMPLWLKLFEILVRGVI